MTALPSTDRPLTAGDAQRMEQIAFNLCSLHDFAPAFVASQERFAKAVMVEYERSRPAPVPEAGEGVELSDVEREILKAMPGDGMCYSFSALEAQLDGAATIEQPVLKAAVRLLSARGLLRFQRGLFNEDGCVYGFGYGLTDRGLASIPALHPAPTDRVAELEAALREARDAVDFFDRVKASTQDEQIAVGRDHWNRMEAALRSVALFSAQPRAKGEGK